MKPRRNNRTTANAAKPKPTTGPTFHIIHLSEPSLEFAFGQQLAYPRDGLFLFGPTDAKKTFATTRYGVIGTPEGVARFQRWSKTMTGYIPIPPPGPRSRPVEPQHVPFPGFKEAFHMYPEVQRNAE